MKYVKTAFGVYERVHDNDKGLIIVRGSAPYGNYIFEEHIIKEADTIEELCDEFVYNNELLAPIYISPKEPLIESWRNSLDYEFNYKNHKEIYGAIWTSKGLIYVAKMNNEGKLELLNE